MRQGRAPFLCAAMGAPDTVEGRFELLTLHVILLIDRLGGRSQISQSLFDAYLADLDGALREMAVGDLSVGKRMRALGQAFYGRSKAWAEALAGLPDIDPIATVLARTVFEGRSNADPLALADYVVRCRRSLAAQDDARLRRGEIDWPQA